ncbi:ABC transporter permease subunit [Rhodococcus koreensis]|uniref:ABC transporter permease subunit n=1 Tax=Rhodococcus koreensis TaxID=99653 RepID=UPI00366F8A21
MIYITFKTGGTTDMASSAPPDVLLAQMLPSAVPQVFTQGMAMFGGALMLILGALTIGSGYGWGTWKTVFTQGPSRSAALAGTLLALLTVVIGLVLTVAAVDVGVATVIAAVESEPANLPAASAMLKALASGTLILAMWTAAGVLVGALARGPALSVGLGLVWVLVVENLLRGVAAILDPVSVVTDFLPGTAAGSLAGSLRDFGGDTTPGVLNILDGSTSVLVLAGYVAAFAAGTMWLVRRRDVN